MGRELSKSSIGAERRHVTVMFCDLVGSSALPPNSTPKTFAKSSAHTKKLALRSLTGLAVISPDMLATEILVYFGYPESHEDDTERAIRAAFGIIEALSEIGDSVTFDPGVELAVRIGAASGLVVAGDMSGPESTEQHAVVGQTPNLAARLQSLAEPNSVLITSHTRQLLGEQFECESLGTVRLHGFSDPILAWQSSNPRLALPASRPLTAEAAFLWSIESERLSCFCSAGARPKRERVNPSCSRGKQALENHGLLSRSVSN